MKKRMSHIRGIACLYLLFLALSLQGQDITLTGHIRDGKEASPLQNVNVVVSPQGSKSIATYTISDSEGNFRLTYRPDEAGAYVIRFSHLGYETLAIDIEKGKAHYDITLRPQAIDIKEVIVKAEKIKAQGDTLTYHVASFSKEGDKTIGDVLKKLPGVRVEEDGKISYQGTTINKFYIEGMDLLGGKYNLATHNISHKDVGSVEILENHQPIKALNGLSLSEQAAINLRLKEKTKQRWIGSLKGGGGYAPLAGLWTAKGIAMHFNKHFQSLNTCKTNNTGQDVTKEFKSFDLNERRYRSEGLTDLIRIGSVYPHELSRQRELFNTTCQVTSNNLFKLKNGMSLTSHVGWMDHREEAGKQTVTQYYQADADTLTVREGESPLFRKQTLTAGTILEINEELYNLTNKLTADFTWKHKDETVAGNLPNTQHSYSPEKQVANDLFLLKKSGKRFIIFSSYSFLQDNPQRMGILYAEGETRTQQVKQQKLFTDNKVDYGIVAGKWVINTTAGIRLSSRQTYTHLTGTAHAPTENDTRLHHTRLYLTGKLEYTAGKLKGYLSLPVFLDRNRYREKATDAREGQTRMYTNPHLYLTYSFSPRWQVDATGSAGSSPGDESLFYTGYILNSYRMMTEGYPVFKAHRRQMIEGNLSYKRPMQEWFGNLRVRYSRSTTPYTPYQRMEEDGCLITSYREGKNTRNQFTASASLSKGISRIKSYLFLDAMFGNTHSLLVRNESRVPNVRKSWHLTPRLESELSRRITLKYKLDYDHSTLTLKDQATDIRSLCLDQQLSIRLSPSASTGIELVAEHYHHESAGNRARNFFLADILLSHKISAKWEVELWAKNLMDERSYVYTSFTDEASTVHRSYDIRPRNLMFTLKYSY